MQNYVKDMSILKCSINYTTFRRDYDWLKFSLASARKYAKGFSGITVVVPTTDLDVFLPIEREFSTPECPVLVRTFLEYPGKGFVHHLAMKSYADIFAPSSTHILSMDPDCLFTSPVTPLDYFIDGNPVLLIEPYEAIKRAGHSGRFYWKEITEKALMFECTHETMCRHPAVHHNWIFKELRRYIETVHQVPFIDFVIKQKNEYPQGYGEHNTLGSFAFKMHPHSYHWIDREFDGEKNDPPSKLIQLWSYTGVDRPDNKAIIEKILS